VEKTISPLKMATAQQTQVVMLSRDFAYSIAPVLGVGLLRLCMKHPTITTIRIKPAQIQVVGEQKKRLME